MHKSTIFWLVVTLAVIPACANESVDELRGGSGDPNDTASGENNTFNHAHESVGGENGVTDVQARLVDDSAAGDPTAVAKMHGAQKISYAALAAMLTDFGSPVAPAAAAKNNGGGGGKKGGTTAAPATAQDLYANGKNALGAPVFGSRTPEMLIPSTSALTKEFDIFVAAAPDILTKLGASKRCPGVALLNGNQLTADGISCLIGKPATADYVTLVNQLVADVGDTQKGPAVAVATLLAAAHISE